MNESQPIDDEPKKKFVAVVETDGQVGVDPSGLDAEFYELHEPVDREENN
jgi:hypothetical protein